MGRTDDAVVLYVDTHPVNAESEALALCDVLRERWLTARIVALPAAAHDPDALDKAIEGCSVVVLLSAFLGEVTPEITSTTFKRMLHVLRAGKHLTVVKVVRHGRFPSSDDMFASFPPRTLAAALCDFHSPSPAFQSVCSILHHNDLEQQQHRQGPDTVSDAQGGAANSEHATCEPMVTTAGAGAGAASTSSNTPSTSAGNGHSPHTVPAGDTTACVTMKCHHVDGETCLAHASGSSTANSGTNNSTRSSPQHMQVPHDVVGHILTPLRPCDFGWALGVPAISKQPLQPVLRRPPRNAAAQENGAQEPDSGTTTGTNSEEDAPQLAFTVVGPNGLPPNMVLVDQDLTRELTPLQDLMQEMRDQFSPGSEAPQLSLPTLASSTLMHLLREQPEYCFMQQQVLAILAERVRQVPADAAELLQDDLYPVIDAMSKHHTQSVSLQVCACRLIAACAMAAAPPAAPCSNPSGPPRVSQTPTQASSDAPNKHTAQDPAPVEEMAAVDMRAAAGAVLGSSKAHLQQEAVQVAACRALKWLARHGTVLNMIAKEGAVYAAMLIPRAHPESIPVLCSFFLMLTSWAERNQETRAQMVEAGVASHITRALREFSSHGLLCECACMLLRRLAVDPASHNALVEAAAVPAVVGAMRVHVGMSTLLCEATLALTCLAGSDDIGDHAMQRAASAGAADVLLAAMRRHATLEPLQSYGFSLLGMLAKQATVASHLLHEGIATMAAEAIRGFARRSSTVLARVCELVEVVALEPKADLTALQDSGVPAFLVFTLRSHAGNAFIARRVLAAIAALCLHSAGFQRLFLDLGTDAIAAQTLERLPSEACVASRAAWALNALLRPCPDVLLSRVSSEGEQGCSALCALLLDAMDRHRAEVEVCYPAAELLCAVARHSEEQRRRLLEACVAERALSCMYACCESADMLCTGLRLLTALCRKNSARVCTALVDHPHGMNVVMLCISKHANAYALQEDLAALLDALCHLRRFLEAFSRYGGTMTALCVMTELPNDASANMRIARVLAALLRNSMTERTLLRSQDGVRILHAAARRHQHNPDFLLQASAVLLQLTAHKHDDLDAIIKASVETCKKKREGQQKRRSGQGAEEACSGTTLDDVYSLVRRLTGKKPSPNVFHLPDQGDSDMENYRHMALTCVCAIILGNWDNPKLNTSIERVLSL